MRAEDWLADTRTSYDTVAESYADLLRSSLTDSPYDRAFLALFAELVRGSGGGPVVDVGCGPGRLTGHLAELGLDAAGVDLSPAMVAVARRDHPDLRFEVGSMTELDLPASTVGGILAWFSLIHVPDDALPAVLTRFRLALRPRGVLMAAFHTGDGTRLKTEGYGGHPMRVHIHKRTPEGFAELLGAAGFAVEARAATLSEGSGPEAVVIARPGPR